MPHGFQSPGAGAALRRSPACHHRVMLGSAAVPEVRWTRRTLAAAVALCAALCWAGAAAGGSAAAAETARPSAAHGGSQRLEVVLGLERRQRALGRFALGVSDPASPRYGRYLGPHRVGLRFGASDATLRRVRGFLRRHRIRARVDVTRSFLEAFVPTRRARRLFKSPSGRTRVPRALRGRVRELLLAQADPGQFLPRPRRTGAGSSRAPGQAGQSFLKPPHVRTGTPAGCPQGRNATAPLRNSPLAGPAFTPNQIQSAYGAAPLHDAGVTGRGVRIGIYGAGGFGDGELHAFARCFGLQVPPTLLVKVGERKAGPTSDEAALDLQMATLMAPGLRSLTQYEIGSGFWPLGISAMLDPRNGPLPNVISVSRGECETDVGLPEIRLTEHVLAAAAAAGITVAVASGDAGAFCTSGPLGGSYPGSSPWITSVGGTAFTLDDANRIVDETPWNDLPSVPEGLAAGGGFGRFLTRPPYQRGLGPWGNHRGYPDVALIADTYPGIATYCNLRNGNCELHGRGNPFESGGGTSYATPLLAGIVALADQRLLAAGRPPIGFANPLLYRLGRNGGQGALRDIFRGSIPSPHGVHCCRALPGYDLASGWGSANAEGLAAAALADGPR
jgi:subtilase family serine protease